MKKLLTWLDENLLFCLTGFLLAFIPLYPKLPLFDIIPGYIVRVRLEDFFIGFTLIVWIIQLIRRKVSFGANPLSRPILAYLIVGILSMLSAIFLIQTVPFETLHIGKMVLHFLRRVEYFSLFFVFYSATKSLKQVKIYLFILLFTIIGITLYGYGQKYLYFPAFSTMNREYSKGWLLYLTNHARVLSTFGGHYDLAAYTMAALVMIWAFFFSVTKKWMKIGLFIIFLAVYWLLILTASRTSFLAYVGGVTVLFFFFMFRNGLRWSASRWFVVMAFSFLIMLSFGDLSDRFSKLLKLDVRLAGVKSVLLQPFSKAPQQKDIALLENNIDAVTSKSDFPLLPNKPTDVDINGPDGVIATQSASGAAILVEVPRTYSQTAIIYDLSTSIRLDALWPQAINGFKKNPLLGSGYSTLNKKTVTDFTEAESTDNDYLRALGETGLLGVISFAWILATIMWITWRVFFSIKDKVVAGLFIGMAGVVSGLLVNAVYIDIFEASKVALSFWAFSGIVLATWKLIPKEDKKRGVFFIPPIPDLKGFIKASQQRFHIIIFSPKFYLTLVLIVGFLLRQYKIHEPLADWHSWRQADTSAVTRNFSREGINIFLPKYDDLSSVASGFPNPNGYRFVEFPIYNTIAVFVDKLFPGYTIEYSGRLTSVFMYLFSTVFIYLIVKRFSSRKVGVLSSLIYTIIPYNIFWTRVILPEPTLVCFTLGMMHFFIKWVESEKFGWYFLAVIFGALALLVKFTAVFFFIPMAVFAFEKWKWNSFKKIGAYLYPIFVVVPFIAWRYYIKQFPEGIPAYTWLFNGNGIRFKGAFFWWIFSERISKLILGGWGLVPFGFGIITVPKYGKKPSYFFHAWAVGLFAYLVTFATGNVQHDYYQIILMPLIAIFVAFGLYELWNGIQKLFNIWMTRSVAAISIAFLLMFGWYQVRDLYNINHPEIVEAGDAVDQVLGDKRGNIIAPYNGDTAFLYQTRRKGWPLMEGSIEQMIDKGAQYYVSVNYDDLTKKLIAIAQDPNEKVLHFKILKQTDRYVIIQLVDDKKIPR